MSAVPKIVRAIRVQPEVAAALELIERVELPSVRELTEARAAIDRLLMRAQRHGTGVSEGQWDKYLDSVLTLKRMLADRRQLAMVAERPRVRRGPPHGRGPDGIGPGTPMPATRRDAA